MKIEVINEMEKKVLEKKFSESIEITITKDNDNENYFNQLSHFRIILSGIQDSSYSIKPLQKPINQRII